MSLPMNKRVGTGHGYDGLDMDGASNASSL